MEFLIWLMRSQRNVDHTNSCLCNGFSMRIACCRWIPSFTVVLIAIYSSSDMVDSIIQNLLELCCILSIVTWSGWYSVTDWVAMHTFWMWHSLSIGWFLYVVYCKCVEQCTVEPYNLTITLHMNGIVRLLMMFRILQISGRKSDLYKCPGLYNSHYMKVQAPAKYSRCKENASIYIYTHLNLHAAFHVFTTTT